MDFFFNLMPFMITQEMYMVYPESIILQFIVRWFYVAMHLISQDCKSSIVECLHSYPQALGSERQASVLSLMQVKAKFSVKLSKSATEVFPAIQKAFGDECLSQR